MGRGSICSWQDYGRRNSSNMPQFTGSRAEFMTSDDIEYKRGDGWFLSYPKLAAIIVVFIIGVLAAGFLGWYINSLPRKKSYDTMVLITEEIEDNSPVNTDSIPTFIHPLKYRLELAPIIDGNDVSKIKGRVVIEFRVDGTPRLSKLSLNAKNITVTGYKLLWLDQERVKARSRRRSWSIEDETNLESHADRVTPDTLNSTETSSENIEEYTQGNGSSVDDSELPNNQRSKPSPRIYSPEIPIKEYEIDNDKELHVLHLSNNIESGIYSLEINYNISIDENIFYFGRFNEYDEQRWLMGTRVEPFAVRRLFPVFDDVQLKSLFSVSVSRPKEMRVLSNMPLRTSRDTLTNWIVDTFDETPLIVAHNLAFTLGHIESVNETTIGDAKVPATFWGDSRRHSPGIYLLDKLGPAVINLIDVFSMPYPLSKLDLVGLPRGIDENIGNPGLISMKQSLFYATDYSPLIVKNNALKTLVHLLGQQWLGGVVSVNWTDTWVLEGSLFYLQYPVIQKIDSSLDSGNSFITDIQSIVMEIDGYSISRPLQSNANSLQLNRLNERYAKGACLIRMLHGAIGDTASKNGYKKFIDRWKYGTTSAAEFFSIMEEEANGLPPEVSVVNVMNSWISQSGYPVVSVVRNYENGSLTIRQIQFTYDSVLDESAKLWNIPLTYVNGSDSWSEPAIVWFKAQREITLDNIGRNSSWILFNVNKTGYYRVQYDDENWALLTMDLEKNHELFPPETRASLVDDVFSLAAAGLTKYETAFDFIKYMQMKERHYAPWGVLMRHVFKLNSLLYETSAYTDFQEYMLKFVSPLYREVGSRLNEGSQLTSIAVKMACVFEHPECLDWSTTTFANIYSDYRMIETIPAYIRKTLYCTIARYGTRKEWNYFVEKAKSIVDKEEKKRLLSSLTCFQAPWILQTILNEVLHEKTFQEEETLMILRAFPKNPAAAQVAFRFVRANWHNILHRYSTNPMVMKSFVLSMLNGFTSDQDVEDFRTFRENNYETMRGGTKYASAIVEANGDFVTSWLRKFLPEIEKLVETEVTDKLSN